MIRARVTIIAVCFCLCGRIYGQSSASDSGWGFTKWARSYKAGYNDKNGQYVGGSQLMHLVPYDGKLYAGVSYWMDKGCMWYGGGRSKGRWGQVLRLDSPTAEWQLEFQLPEKCLRPELLDVVTFKTDGKGKRLRRPVSFLVTGNYFQMGHRTVGVRCFARDDKTGEWESSLIHSSRGNFGEDYSIRAIHVHRDRVTGVDMVFATIGVKGIFSGVYDPSAPGRIRWNKEPEKGNLTIRPLAIVDADKSLCFSSGHYVFKRIDGPNPKYITIEDLTDLHAGPVNSPCGGIRGLTAVDSPSGKGQSLIFVWTPVPGRIPGDIYRLDPVSKTKYTRQKEVALADVLSAYLKTDVYFVLGGYNCFLPVTYGHETEHIVGFESVVKKKEGMSTFKSNQTNSRNGYYRGGAFAIRNRRGEYRIEEIEGKGGIKQSDPPLAATVSYALSPFRKEPAIYFGGLDPNHVDATNHAWIYKGVVKSSGRKKSSGRNGRPVTNEPFRTWTSSKGSTISAKLVSIGNGTVVLQKRTGKRIRIRSSALSTRDQSYLTSL